MKSFTALAATLALAACASAANVAPGPAPDPVVAAAVTWTCPNGVIVFTQATRGGNVELAAAGETHWLPKVKAASGARYKNKTTEFWEKGGEATLSGVAGGPYKGCKR